MHTPLLGGAFGVGPIKTLSDESNNLPGTGECSEKRRHREREREREKKDNFWPLYHLDKLVVTRPERPVCRVSGTSKFEIHRSLYTYAYQGWRRCTYFWETPTVSIFKIPSALAPGYLET